MVARICAKKCRKADRAVPAIAPALAAHALGGKQCGAETRHKQPVYIRAFGSLYDVCSRRAKIMQQERV